MVVLRPFETSVNISQSTGRNLPEDFHLHRVHRVSSGGIATRYELDGTGIQTRWGRYFPAPVQIGPGAHPASYTMGIRPFPG